VHSWVPVTARTKTSTGFVWPRRCARPTACLKAAASGHGSKKTTVDAAVRLSPTPPALSVATSAVTLSAPSAATARSRSRRGVDPVNDATATSAAASAFATSAVDLC